MMYVKLFLTLAVVSFVQVSTQASGPPTFKKVSGLVVEHREKITDGVFVIVSRVSFGSGPLAGTSRSEKLTVYLSAPDRLRVTSSRDFGVVSSRGEKPTKRFEASSARVGNSVLNYNDAAFTGGTTIAPTIVDYDSSSDSSLTDPRLVGLALYTYANLHDLNLDDVMYHGVYDERFVGGERNVRGHDCIELVSVRGTRANPALQKTVFVDTKRDYNVLRIELFGQSINATLDVDLQDVPGFGWFPKNVRLRKMRNDKLENSSELTIAVKSINEGVDDRVFTLVGMGAPLGARVYDHRGGEIKEMRLTEAGLQPWSSPRENIDLVAEATPGWGWRRWLILINAIIVAAIGVALMIRAKRRSAST